MKISPLAGFQRLLTKVVMHVGQRLRSAWCKKRRRASPDIVVLWYFCIIDDRLRSGQHECFQPWAPARIYTPPHWYPYTLHSRTYCASGYHCPHIGRPAKSRDFLLSSSVMILGGIINLDQR